MNTEQTPRSAYAPPAASPATAEVSIRSLGGREYDPIGGDQLPLAGLQLHDLRRRVRGVRLARAEHVRRAHQRVLDRLHVDEGLVQALASDLALDGLQDRLHHDRRLVAALRE